MIRALLLLFLLAGPAAATQDQWPALFDVSGVAPDDVLNIRAAPSASAEIIGTLAPDAAGVEVVRPDSRHGWGLVNTGEGSGWASLAFLVRRPGQWLGAEIPAAACYGTEPFWSFGFNGSVARWSTPEGGAEGQVLQRMSTLARRDVQGLSFRLNDETDGVAILRLEACSDGMSDRAFGIRAELVRGSLAGPSLWSGCCSLVTD